MMPGYCYHFPLCILSLLLQFFNFWIGPYIEIIDKKTSSMNIKQSFVQTKNYLFASVLGKIHKAGLLLHVLLLLPSPNLKKKKKSLAILFVLSLMDQWSFYALCCPADMQAAKHYHLCL